MNNKTDLNRKIDTMRVLFDQLSKHHKEAITVGASLIVDVPDLSLILYCSSFETNIDNLTNENNFRITYLYEQDILDAIIPYKTLYFYERLVKEAMEEELQNQTN